MPTYEDFEKKVLIPNKEPAHDVNNNNNYSWNEDVIIPVVTAI